MKIIKHNTFIFLISLLFLLQLKVRCQLVYSGVEGENITPVFAERSTPQWCWAACIQLVLNSHGIMLSQEDILRHTFQIDNPYDSLPSWKSSLNSLASNLNKWKITYCKYKYSLNIKYDTAVPSAKELKMESSLYNPVILLYQDSTANVHPVVCIAVGFIPGYYGPVIKGLMIRDPSPDCKTNISTHSIKFPISILKKNICAYWTIHVKKIQ